MEIGNRIKYRRELLGMSQEELAKKIGYKSRSSINKIEIDGRGLPQSKIVAFAKALETTPAYLMGWTDVPNAKEQYDVYVDVEATSKEEAIFIAIKNMLIAEGKNEMASTITQEEAVKLYNSLGFDSVKIVDDTPITLAAHFDGDEYTEEELDEIKKFAEFVKSKRK